MNKEKIIDQIDDLFHRRNSLPPEEFAEKLTQLAQGFCNQDSQEKIERTQLAVESSEYGLWDWDIQNNQVYWNDIAYTMLGYKPQEFLISINRWKEMVHPDDLNSAWNAVQNILENPDQILNIEYRIQSKDGSYIWRGDRGRVSEVDANGKARRMTGTHRDITARKNAEEALLNKTHDYQFLSQTALRLPLLTKEDERSEERRVGKEC